MADRRLETLQQQVQRRSATPEPGAAASVGAREVPWVAAPPQHARQHAAPQATPPAAPAPQQEQLGPPPAASPPPIPPSDMSIVRTVTTATGTGCKDVLAAHATVLLPPGACWTSRGHRVLHLESSCILQLYGRTTCVLFRGQRVGAERQSTTDPGQRTCCLHCNTRVTCAPHSQPACPFPSSALQLRDHAAHHLCGGSLSASHCAAGARTLDLRCFRAPGRHKASGEEPEAAAPPVQV